MKTKIVQSKTPVLLVGGGACDDKGLTAALARAEAVVAADGGAERLLRAGHMPDAVYGDMDSLSAQSQAQLAPGVLRPIAEQDSTDFDKCLRHIEAPLVIGHGFLGARIDHQLAAMNVLVRRPDRRCILVGEFDVICLLPPEIMLELPPRARVSLFPMGEVTGTSQGLRWPLDGLRFAPGGTSGTSNEVADEAGGRPDEAARSARAVRLEMAAARMLLILPVQYLEEMSAALMRAPRWPVARA